MSVKITINPVSKKKLDTSNCEKYAESKKLKFDPKILIKIILTKKINNKPSNVPGKIFLKILKEIFFGKFDTTSPHNLQHTNKIKICNQSCLNYVHYQERKKN